MSALVVIEHNDIQVRPASLSAIHAATQLTDDVHALVIGYQCDAIVAELKPVVGVKKILVVDHEIYQHPLAEVIAALVVQHAADYEYLLTAATSFGKDFMPRVAAKLDVAQISDVTKIVTTNTFERPIYAGNAIETVESLDDKKVLTVRATAFAPAGIHDEEAAVASLDGQITFSKSQFTKLLADVSERPELSSARIVIAGGRGLQTKEAFHELASIAAKINAAMGASRAAVDAELVPNDLQVGQTGQIVAPELYIAIGISGAIQHLAGMKDSKVIVAINKDPEAPIFQVADFGLVADWFQIKDDFIRALDALKERV